MPPEQPVKKSFQLAAGLFEPSKKVKKSFDPTRKGTLTVPFHTIPPSEAFKQEELLTISVGGTICAAHSSVY
ncbi:hypothetical protein [Flavonifractor plautii]|uniref:hypothetical protein n=1 Tax=Flavonifractor plautii TaxID=292800 RepID=UPI003EEFB7EB